MAASRLSFRYVSAAASAHHSLMFEYMWKLLAQATRVADIWIVWPQDGIRVEFEEQLPLREYALRIPL